MSKLSKEVVSATQNQLDQIFQCVSHGDLKKEYLLLVEELEGKIKSDKEAEALAKKLADEAKKAKEVKKPKETKKKD